jgi:hypothetical protein
MVIFRTKPKISKITPRAITIDSQRCRSRKCVPPTGFAVDLGSELIANRERIEPAGGSGRGEPVCGPRGLDHLGDERDRGERGGWPRDVQVMCHRRSDSPSDLRVRRDRLITDSGGPASTGLARPLTVRGNGFGRRIQADPEGQISHGHGGSGTPQSTCHPGTPPSWPAPGTVPPSFNPRTPKVCGIPRVTSTTLGSHWCDRPERSRPR